LVCADAEDAVTIAARRVYAIIFMVSVSFMLM